MLEQNKHNETFDQWAIVDVMGHQRFVGRVTEQVIAGTGFVRIDVPETPKAHAWTKLVGTASIYAITPITEEIARDMAEKRNDSPISLYDLSENMRKALSVEASIERGVKNGFLTFEDEYDGSDDDESPV
jgi:hypothetical protein